MPDTRSHRGAHPEDGELFAAPQLPAIRAAVSDMSWLLSRSYSEQSALKVVGDRYQLHERQRTAVKRCACSDVDRSRRRAAAVSEDVLAGSELLVDGFNILVTVEVALSGGYVLLGRDGACRDLAGLRGTYRQVTETVPALELVGRYFEERKVGSARFLFDAPVSNSGRIKVLCEKLAAEHNWKWSGEVVRDPDEVLLRSEGVVISSDSMVINEARSWFPVLQRVAPASSRILDLGSEG